MAVATGIGSGSRSPHLSVGSRRILILKPSEDWDGWSTRKLGGCGHFLLLAPARLGHRALPCAAFRINGLDGARPSEEGLLLREGARVAVVAGEVLVGCVDVKKPVAFSAEIFELGAAALGENGVAGVAVAGCNGALAVRRFVEAIVAAEATSPILVADIVGVGAPISFHFGKEIAAENGFCFVDQRGELRLAGID